MASREIRNLRKVVQVPCEVVLRRSTANVTSETACCHKKGSILVLSVHAVLHSGHEVLAATVPIPLQSTVVQVTFWEQECTCAIQYMPEQHRSSCAASDDALRSAG